MKSTIFFLLLLAFRVHFPYEGIQQTFLWRFICFLTLYIVELGFLYDKYYLMYKTSGVLYP